MQVTENKPFDFNESIKRMEGYLSHPVDAERVEKVPLEDRFDYNTGYYVNCCAVFVDIRDSSLLTDEDTKKNVSKIYRSFVSEITAKMQSYKQCKHINIVGDCVSGVFNTSNRQEDLSAIFMMVGGGNTLIKMLNRSLKNHNLPEIEVGIGIDYGESLVVKAGYKGSGLDELVWMGDVVNNAAHLCNDANKDGKPVVLCSVNFYNGLGTSTCKRYYDQKTVQCKSFLKNIDENTYGGYYWKVLPNLGVD